MLLNTEKYPPSLQFLLMTLGPVLVLLGSLARLDQHMDPCGWLGRLGGGSHPRDGSGFGLFTVYAVWLAISALLYLACVRFASVKRRRDCWWLRYL